jgi:HNH endonuclease
VEGAVHRWFAVQATRARTGQGIVAAAIALTLVLAVFANVPSVGAALILLLLLPLVWLFAWRVAGLPVAAWRRRVAGRPPDVRVGRPWKPGSTRQQLREDRHARVFDDRGGILFRKRHWFVASGTPPVRIDVDLYAEMSARQHDDPQPIAWCGDRRYFWYHDAVYWTNREDLSSHDVKALLFARERQRQRQLDHAHAVMAAESLPPARKREPIPREVKQAVFERDEGRCVECGRNFEFQYDHVTPFSMGGANTVENLRLLCGPCNQRKGGRL